MTRIGAAIQPAGGQTVNVLTDVTAFALRTRPRMGQRIESAHAGWEKQLANLLIILFTPASMLALVFGLWRVSEDLGWAETFIIGSGLFSHWQVWIALAIALKFAGASLQARIPGAAKTPAEN